MEEMAENPQTQDVPETSATDLAELKEKGCILYSKVKIYDVVFKRFFAVDENVKKFYESVSNRKIRLEDIERVTLEEGKSFETQIANDLGFLVKNDDGQDEFVFLVEAQSTWNDNMPYRFWDYLVEIFRNYTRDHHLDKHHKRHFFFPGRAFISYTPETEISLISLVLRRKCSNQEREMILTLISAFMLSLRQTVKLCRDNTSDFPKACHISEKNVKITDNL